MNGLLYLFLLFEIHELSLLIIVIAYNAPPVTYIMNNE